MKKIILDVEKEEIKVITPKRGEIWLDPCGDVCLILSKQRVVVLTTGDVWEFEAVELVKKLSDGFEINFK